MKGIIVVDIPERCIECNALSCEGECLAMDICTVDVDTMKGKPDWCPIKPIPEKKEVRETIASFGGVFLQGRETGWNDCIDEILKGDENGQEQIADR